MYALLQRRIPLGHQIIGRVSLGCIHLASLRLPSFTTSISPSLVLSLSTAAAVAIRTVASVLRSMGTQATLSVWQYQVGGFDPPASRLILRMEMNQSLEGLAPSHQKTGSKSVLLLLSSNAVRILGSKCRQMCDHSQQQKDCA